MYFDSFGIEYIPQEVLSNVKDKSIIHNILRTQSNDSIIGRFYRITFIKYMIAEKMTNIKTNDYIKTNGYIKNEKIIYKYFKEHYGNPSF